MPKTSKPVATDKVKVVKLGDNIRAYMKGDTLFLKIDTTQEGSESASGKSMLVARSGMFAGLDELLPGAGMALNLTLSKRIAKAAKKDAVKKATKPAKKRRRDDDEDDD